jgi:hypothetical protein
VTQMMLELTVIFANPTIPNRAWLTEPDINDMYESMKSLRAVADDELGTLLDEQCFYRLFKRDHPTD